MRISRPINNASVKRKEKRESEQIAAELERLTKRFIQHVKDHSIFKEVDNLGFIFTQNSIALLYKVLEADWMRFCKRKWKFSKTIPSAFETCVKSNFHLTGIKIKKHD